MLVFLCIHMSQMVGPHILAAAPAEPGKMPADSLGCRHLGGFPQMGIAHGCTGIAVAEQLLNFIKGMPRVHQKTCERMSQVMDAHVRKPNPAPQTVPERPDVGERLARRMAGKKPGTDRNTRDGTDNLHNFIG